MFTYPTDPKQIASQVKAYRSCLARNEFLQLSYEPLEKGKCIIEMLRPLTQTLLAGTAEMKCPISLSVDLLFSAPVIFPLMMLQ